MVPFFDPGIERLHHHVAELVTTLEHEAVEFEVIAVSDGSTDGSSTALADLEPLWVRTIVLTENRGKVRRCTQASTPRTVGISGSSTPTATSRPGCGSRS